jgi:hypothetical protein
MLNMMNMQLTPVIHIDIAVLCHTFKNHILVKPKMSIYVSILGLFNYILQVLKLNTINRYDVEKIMHWNESRKY